MHSLNQQQQEPLTYLTIETLNQHKMNECLRQPFAKCKNKYLIVLIVVALLHK